MKGTDVEKTSFKAPMPALIGHRGLPLLSPENTRSSFQCAADNGIEWIEVDVTTAGDDSLVIMHDLTLKLFGMPEKELINLTEAELKQVDAGSWFNESFKGEPLLFLAELLTLIHSLELSMNLEIKINPGLDVRHQVKLVLDVLEQYRFPFDRLLISSFDLDALAVLRELSPDIPIGVLFEELPENLPTVVAHLNPLSIHCDQATLKENDAKIIASQYPLYCYTVNDTVTFEKLLSWGVAGIFSDRAHARELHEALAAFRS